MALNPVIMAAIIKAVLPNSSIAMALTPEIFEKVGDFVIETVKQIQAQFGDKPSKFKHAQALQRMGEKMPYRDDFNMGKLIHEFVPYVKSVK